MNVHTKCVWSMGSDNRVTRLMLKSMYDSARKTVLGQLCLCFTPKGFKLSVAALHVSVGFLFFLMEHEWTSSFVSKSGKPLTNKQNTWNSLQTEAVSHASVFAFFKRFRERHEDYEGVPRNERPSTAQNLEIVAIVCELLARDHCMAEKVTEV
jgi:hypothetical protein